MDDSAELEINPVLKYIVAEEKKAAVRAAQERAAEAAASGLAGAQEERTANDMAGVPGALARLGFKLSKKDDGDASELRKQDNKRQKASIAAYFTRKDDIDSSYDTTGQKNVAGGLKMTALDKANQMAEDKKSEKTAEQLLNVAKASRVQLNKYAMKNPNGTGGAGSLSEIMAAANSGL